MFFTQFPRILVEKLHDWAVNSPFEHIKISFYDFRENQSTSVGQLRDLMSNLPPSLTFLRNTHRLWNGMMLAEEPRGLENFWQFSNYWNIPLLKITVFLLCQIPKIPAADPKLQDPVKIKARFFLCPSEFDLLYPNIGTLLIYRSYLFKSFLYFFFSFSNRKIFRIFRNTQYINK